MHKLREAIHSFFHALFDWFFSVPKEGTLSRAASLYFTKYNTQDTGYTSRRAST